MRSIIISGAHRTGTTWFGRMLSLAKKTRLYGEPFTPTNCLWYLGDNFIDNWYYYFTKNDRSFYYQHIKHGLGLSFDFSDLKRHILVSNTLRTRFGWVYRYANFYLNKQFGVRYLIKDPMLFFNLEWIYEEFPVVVILVVRHPAAFVASIKRMNSQRGWGIGLNDWLLNQDFLMSDILYRFKDELKDYANSTDLIEKSAFFWNVIYMCALKYKLNHKDWIFVNHEDYALEPERAFKHLYDQLELEYTDDIQNTIRSINSKDNNSMPEFGAIHYSRRNSISTISNWKLSLTEEEKRKVYAISGSIAKNFYSDSSWE